MKLLVVCGHYRSHCYRMTWGREVKLLLVSQLDSYARAINTIHNYVRVGTQLGHEVAVFGEQQSQDGLPHSLDVKGFDFAIFVIYETTDFPALPYLAQLLDGVPKERRVILDCAGRYNETVRVEHDFNHLEKLDGHQGWEWVEGFQAVSDRILQPTLSPRRPDVQPFLFHAFDAGAVAGSHRSSREAAEDWSAGERKSHGVIYVGNNWQRWTQIAGFLEAVAPIRDELGPICLAGWGWDERPDWAIELGLRGVDVDPGLLETLRVEVTPGKPFHEVNAFVGQARFAPVFHRPLFNELGLVTNRTFETFSFDALPLLFLSEDLVEAIHGPDALPLVAGDDLAAHIADMLKRPEPYWQAVLRTRERLATQHSYERRFKELSALLEA